MSSLTRQPTVKSVSHPSLFVDAQVSFLKVKLEFSEQQVEWNEQRAQSASTDTQICLLCLFAGDTGKLNGTSVRHSSMYSFKRKSKQTLFKYRFTLLYTHHYNTKDMSNINIPAADRFYISFWGQSSSLLRNKIEAVPRLKSNFSTKIAQDSLDRPESRSTFSYQKYSPTPGNFPWPISHRILRCSNSRLTRLAMTAPYCTGDRLSEIQHLPALSDKLQSWHQRGQWEQSSS